MRTFRCSCGARTFFENTTCLACGLALGFLPDASELATLPSPSAGRYRTEHGEYRMCSNYVVEGVCNWMVPAASKDDLCQACDLNRVIPDLSQPANRVAWADVEKAKRRLVYTLNGLGLPLRSKRLDPERGLAFDIKAASEKERVLTGHADGLVTLNIAEANAAEREHVRLAMKERYRTLLGHFRHEVGHYYWDELLARAGRLDSFRALFGDERQDYGEALKRHYAKALVGPPSDAFVSAYAAAHPWEDFAETFAHYLHCVDTLQTAQAFGFVHDVVPAATPRVNDFEQAYGEWTALSVALNSLNRSMGLLDAYPFAVGAGAKEKLRFVHELILPEG